MPIPTARNKGFTLIELLLVIAIMAIIASLAVMTYRRSFINHRIDQVSMEMQHVLEGAMAYNVDHNGQWPPENTNFPDCAINDEKTQDFVRYYLPNANPRSYLGSQYCWGVDHTRLFWVAIRVPNANVLMAQRIAAALPNAITTEDPQNHSELPAPCTTSDCYVRAEITQPGATSNQSQGATIAAVGDCQTGQTISNAFGGNCQSLLGDGSQQYQISFTACPQNSFPRLSIMPNFYVAPNASVGYAIQSITATSNLNSCSTQGTTLQTCLGRVSVQVKTYKGSADAITLGGAEGASYIVACIHQGGKYE